MDKTHDCAFRNRKIAIYAENNSFFEIATSRYYYELFLLMTIYLKTNGVNIPKKDDFLLTCDPKLATTAKYWGSHDFTIYYFIETVREKEDITLLKDLSKLQELKHLRNKYEYKANFADKNEFEKVFKLHYEAVLKKVKTIAKYTL